MTRSTGPRVPAEKPDPAAERPAREGADRPGSSLGGAQDRSGTGGDVPAGAFRCDTAPGAAHFGRGDALTSGHGDER